jgi:hypothetical protein
MLAGSDLRFVRRLLYSFARHVWSAKWQPSTEARHQATLHLHHEFHLFNSIPLIVMDIHVKQVCVGITQEEKLILYKYRLCYIYSQ